MRIVYSASYDQMYGDLKRNEQLMVDDAIALFREDPFHPALVNHPL